MIHSRAVFEVARKRKQKFLAVHVTHYFEVPLDCEGYLITVNVNQSILTITGIVAPVGNVGWPR